MPRKARSLAKRQSASREAKPMRGRASSTGASSAVADRARLTEERTVLEAHDVPPLAVARVFGAEAIVLHRPQPRLRRLRSLGIAQRPRAAAAAVGGDALTPVRPRGLAYARRRAGFHWRYC